MPSTAVHPEIELAARANLAQVLPVDIAPEALDLDADLDGYGLTSLNKVLFLTSLCDDAEVELHHFTEHDLARMRTLRQVADAVAQHAPRAV